MGKNPKPGSAWESGWSCHRATSCCMHCSVMAQLRMVATFLDLRICHGIYPNLTADNNTVRLRTADAVLSRTRAGAASADIPLSSGVCSQQTTSSITPHAAEPRGQPYNQTVPYTSTIPQQLYTRCAHTAYTCLYWQHALQGVITTACGHMLHFNQHMQDSQWCVPATMSPWKALDAKSLLCSLVLAQHRSEPPCTARQQPCHSVHHNTCSYRGFCSEANLQECLVGGTAKQNHTAIPGPNSNTAHHQCNMAVPQSAVKCGSHGWQMQDHQGHFCMIYHRLWPPQKHSKNNFPALGHVTTAAAVGSVSIDPSELCALLPAPAPMPC